MPVKVRCGECRKVLSVPDKARGKAVKCPDCGSRIPVPAGKAKAAAPQKAAKPSSEFAIANIDLSRLEDTRVRICPKCAAELSEEDLECPVCGADPDTGGAGITQQRRAARGGRVDPSEYTAGLWKFGWGFVGKNKKLAGRSMAYLTISAVLFVLASWMYLRQDGWGWPPMVLWGFVMAVCGLVPIGWMWHLQIRILDALLEKKKKLKRVTFDFFLNAALGIKFFAWNTVFGFPILLLPILAGFALERNGTQGALFVGIAAGFVPLLFFYPVGMSHMAMPVQFPGWMIHRVAGASFRHFQSAFLWMILTLTVNLPTIVGLGLVAVVFGPSITGVVNDIQYNARTAAALDAADRGEEIVNQPQQQQQAAQPREIKWTSLIIPGSIFLTTLLIMPWPAMFSMATLGRFTTTFKKEIGLVTRKKEYKYVAKLPRAGEEDDEQQPMGIKEALVVSLVVQVLGFVGGMLYGTFSTDVGMILGMAYGFYYGSCFVGVIGRISFLTAASAEGPMWFCIVFFVPFGELIFVATHWDEGKVPLTYEIVATVGIVIGAIWLFVGLLSDAIDQQQPQPPGADPAADPAAVPAAMRPIDDSFPNLALHDLRNSLSA